MSFGQGLNEVDDSTSFRKPDGHRPLFAFFRKPSCVDSFQIAADIPV